LLVEAVVVAVVRVPIDLVTEVLLDSTEMAQDKMVIATQVT
jgi:hypothetical protein